MSAQSLLNFLQKLDNDLTMSKAGPYRELIANKRPHTFKFNVLTFEKEVYLEMEHRGLSVTSKDRAVVKGLCSTMLTGLTSELQSVANLSGSKIRKTKNTVSLQFTSNTITNRVGQYSKPGDVFDKIKDTYRPYLQQFFKDLQEHLLGTKETNPETGRQRGRQLRTKSGKTVAAAGRFKNAGHFGESGVLQTMIRDIFDNLVEHINVTAANGSNISRADLEEDLKELGIDLSIRRNDKKDSHTIVLESATDNVARGREIQQKRKELEAQIKNAISKLEKDIEYGVGLSNLKGSSSIREKKDAKALEATLSPFRKVKGVRVKSDQKKIVKSTETAQNKKSQPKAVKGSSTNLRLNGKSVIPKTSRRVKGKKAVNINPIGLVALLNKRLPSQVAKNMGEPGLVYRSGRFASSVRVVDVITTPQGYPSFGYTYQQNPYRVFEQGSNGNWSSEDRDPRNLINKSIREIAAQYAIARFYTRRL